MPHRTVGDQRWTRSGENEGGDPMYTRSVEEPSSGYDDFTKDELQQLLRNRDLPVSGSKDELIARLEDA